MQLGMHCMHGAVLGNDRARLERLAALVTDPRWGVTFKLIEIGHVPGKPITPAPPARIAAKDLSATARDALDQVTFESALFGVSRKDESDTARLFIHTGRYNDAPGWANSRWSVPDADAERAAASWIELQHAIVEAIGAQHGVIVVAPTPELARIEVWLSNVSLNGRPLHPSPAEISSLGSHRRELGDKYLRTPRWGTYLAPAHVAALSGRDHVLRVVAPAVVREVGPLLYLQLSERVAEAHSPATEAKRAAFEQLVAPLLPPRD